MYLLELHRYHLFVVGCHFELCVEYRYLSHKIISCSLKRIVMSFG